ncbi:MAG: hypothetical protein WBF58_20965 [Xanthobacteraceae bacterium]
MASQAAAKKKLMLGALLAMGFASLIGAREAAGPASAGGDGAIAALPIILAAAGTLCFITAGVLARKMMKETARR